MHILVSFSLLYICKNHHSDVGQFQLIIYFKGQSCTYWSVSAYYIFIKIAALTLVSSGLSYIINKDLSPQVLIGRDLDLDRSNFFMESVRGSYNLDISLILICQE